MHFQNILSNKMDCRIKPGNDGSVFVMVPALRSSAKNDASRVRDTELCANSFSQHEKVFSETAPNARRSSAQRRRD
jgi:hypothetical protein